MVTTQLQSIQKIYYIYNAKTIEDKTAHPYAYQPGDFERVLKRLLKHGFEPIFLGNPFGTSFPEQSCVMGFAMRGELAERLKARVPAGDDGIFQRIEIEVHGDNLNVQVIN